MLIRASRRVLTVQGEIFSSRLRFGRGRVQVRDRRVVLSQADLAVAVPVVARHHVLICRILGRAYWRYRS